MQSHVRKQKDEIRLLMFVLLLGMLLVGGGGEAGKDLQGKDAY